MDWQRYPEGCGCLLPDNAAHGADLLDVPLGFKQCVLLLEANSCSASAGCNYAAVFILELLLVGQDGERSKKRGDNVHEYRINVIPSA